MIVLSCGLSLRQCIELDLRLLSDLFCRLFSFSPHREDHRRDDEDVQEAAPQAAVDAPCGRPTFTAMITVECVNGITHVSFPQAEMPPDRLNVFLDWLRQPPSDRVTTVDPLPRAVWERVYAQPDEFAAVTPEQLAALQVQEEPQ